MKFNFKMPDFKQPQMRFVFGTLLVLLAGSSALQAQDSSQTVKKEIKNKHVKIVVYENDSIVNGTKNRTLTESNTPKVFKEELVTEQSGEAENTIEEIEVEEAYQVESQQIERIYIDEDDDNAKKENKPKLVEQSWLVMDIGLNTWLSPRNDLDDIYEPLELNSAKSVNFHLGIIQQGLNLYKGKLRLVYGLGVEFNNYRFKKNVDLTPDSKTLTFALNSDVNYSKNKLVSQYATIPLMLNFKSNPEDEDESFNLAAGIQLGYLIGSHTKQKWTEGGRKEKTKVKGDYNFEDYRLGYVLQFGYGDFNLIAKYYPTAVFTKNQGPVVNTASVGLVISPF